MATLPEKWCIGLLGFVYCFFSPSTSPKLLSSNSCIQLLSPHAFGSRARDSRILRFRLHPIRDQGVGGSNPLSPTIQNQQDAAILAPGENSVDVDFEGEEESEIKTPTIRSAFSCSTPLSNAFARQPCGPHWSIAAIYRSAGRTRLLMGAFVVSLP
jgi:hypothetical protein